MTRRFASIAGQPTATNIQTSRAAPAATASSRPIRLGNGAAGREGPAVSMRPAFDARRAWNIVAQAFDRVKGAMQMTKSDGGGEEAAQDGFTLKSHTSFSDFSLRPFLELCLSENERRFAPYDRRLLRPVLVPSTVKALLKVLPRNRSAAVSKEAA